MYVYATIISLYARTLNLPSLLPRRGGRGGVSRVADPDPVFLHGSGSGSRKVSKSDLSEENLKFITKDRQKMKKATISY